MAKTFDTGILDELKTYAAQIAAIVETVKTTFPLNYDAPFLFSMAANEARKYIITHAPDKTSWFNILLAALNLIITKYEDYPVYLQPHCLGSACSEKEYDNILKHLFDQQSRLSSPNESKIPADRRKIGPGISKPNALPPVAKIAATLPFTSFKPLPTPPTAEKDFCGYKKFSSIAKGSHGIISGVAKGGKKYAFKEQTRDAITNIPGLSAQTFLEHKNILPIHEILYDCPKDGIGLVTPLAYTDLFHLLEQFDFNTMDATRATQIKRWRFSLFCDVICGLEAIHEAGFMHLDLKPENIFVDENGVAKIADFDFAQNVYGGDYDFTPGSLGTLEYQSPELTCGLRRWG